MIKTKKTPILEFERVDVRRGDQNILNNLNFRIFKGERVAILGPNGSGKSTLIKTLARELYPTHGHLRLFGQQTWNVFELRRHFGLISDELQHGCLRDVSGRALSAMEVVLSGYFSSVGLWNPIDASMKKKAMYWLSRLGVSPQTHIPTTQLSAGQVRRVLLARALVHEPEALLLDEPMNNLDIAAIQSFRKILSDLSSRRTIIIVSHRLEDLIPEISRVILIKKGAVFADGPKIATLSEPVLENLFDVPLAITCHKGHYSWNHK